MLDSAKQRLTQTGGWHILDRTMMGSFLLIVLQGRLTSQISSPAVRECSVTVMQVDTKSQGTPGFVLRHNPAVHRSTDLLALADVQLWLQIYVNYLKNLLWETHEMPSWINWLKPENAAGHLRPNLSRTLSPASTRAKRWVEEGSG